jgi:hypothetical protein
MGILVEDQGSGRLDAQLAADGGLRPGVGLRSSWQREPEQDGKQDRFQGFLLPSPGFPPPWPGCKPINSRKNTGLRRTFQRLF